LAALLNVYDPTMWAQETLMQLFPKLKMANLVHRDFENLVASKGSTVTTRMPNKFTATDVNPDSFNSVKPTAENVSVVMDQWKQVVFEIGDKEATFSLKNLIEEFMDPAAQALGLSIENSLMGMYKDVANVVGAAGTTPATVAALGTDIKQRFDELNIPEDSRRVILGPAAQNKFNQVFYQAYVSGSAAQQTDGDLVRKFGLDFTSSSVLPSHVTGIAGTVTATGVQAGSLAALDSVAGGTLVVGGMSANAKKGDLIQLSHGGSIGTVTYVITADTPHADGVATLPIYPALVASTVGSDEVTIVASHAVNLAFHKQAFCLVSRPMAVPAAPGAQVATAELNGIGIRSTVWYEPKDVRTYVRIDALWGKKTLDARKAIRVLG
jgi:hypothetical protein